MPRHGEKPRQAATIHWSDPKSTREFWASGCDTITDAATELEVGVAVPLVDTVNGISRFFESIAFKEGVGGSGSWDAVATYNKSPDLKQHTFDIGVSNTKMLEALELLAIYDCKSPVYSQDPGGFPPGVPNFGKAINVHDNTVSGVDVEIGRTEYSVDKLFKFSELASSYLQTVRDMSPSVNSQDYTLKWNGQILFCPAGSLRFRGAPAKQISQDGLAMTFKFSYSKNITVEDNITIGASFAITKRGWDYLWPYYEAVQNSTTYRRVQSPASAYVVRVYNYADFADLQLDGPTEDDGDD